MVFGNGQDIYVVACQRFAKGRPLAYISEMRVAFYLVHQVFKVGVGVWIAVGEIDIIVCIGEGIVPAQGEVGFVDCAAFAIAVLVVLNIVSCPMPANIFFLALSLGVNDHLHPHFVQIVHFVLIQNVELDCMILEGVRYFKKEPLRVPIGVYVVLQQQIVLRVAHL